MGIERHKACSRGPNTTVSPTVSGLATSGTIRNHSARRCQYYVAVEAGAFTPTDVGRFQFPSMLVAEVEMFGGLISSFACSGSMALAASQRLCADDQPGFEAWIGRPFAHGMELFELKIQLPIGRLSSPLNH